MNPQQEPINNVPDFPIDPQAVPPKKKPVILIVGIVIAAAIVLGAVYWVMRDNEADQTSNPSATTTEQATTASVVINKDGFLPATIKVKKGTTVTWTNQDASPHRVASDPHPTHEGLPGLDSGEPLAKGDTYSFTFEKTGTFTYHDHLNPMTLQATVVIE
jgi:plastocyanin